MSVSCFGCFAKLETPKWLRKCSYRRASFYSVLGRLTSNREFVNTSPTGLDGSKTSDRGHISAHGWTEQGQPNGSWVLMVAKLRQQVHLRAPWPSESACLFVLFRCIALNSQCCLSLPSQSKAIQFNPASLRVHLS